MIWFLLVLVFKDLRVMKLWDCHRCVMWVSSGSLKADFCIYFVIINFLFPNYSSCSRHLHVVEYWEPFYVVQDTSSSIPVFLQAVFSWATKPVPVVTSVMSLISYFRDPVWTLTLLNLEYDLHFSDSFIYSYFHLTTRLQW